MKQIVNFAFCGLLTFFLFQSQYRLNAESSSRSVSPLAALGQVQKQQSGSALSDSNGVQWVSLGGLPGADGTIYAAAADESGNLYVGGSFSIIGNVCATNIAKWDGHEWCALGTGLNRTVNALATSGSILYAGGAFTTAGGIPANQIAKWNGNSWSALGSGLKGGPVKALVVSGSELYAGGYFTNVGRFSNTGVAKWNGSQWLAWGRVDGWVDALAVAGTDLYVAGAFNSFDGISATNIAKWNGNTWSQLGSGINREVIALTASGSDVYAGGEFTQAGGVSTPNIAKWDGHEWAPIPFASSGEPSRVLKIQSLTLLDNDLYASGSFVVGTATITGIAKWDGKGWSLLGERMKAHVNALVFAGADLYAGGAGGLLSKWTENRWAPISQGIDNAVTTLAVSSNGLYVAGAFTLIGGTSACHVAEWNGLEWSALGSGIRGLTEIDYNPVKALAASENELYAGGIFTNAGGVLASNVAKWNGTEWSPMGSGINGHVFALAIVASNVYAGGEFTNKGGISAINIARWNSQEWSALDPIGINGSVFALLHSGTDLYAGGSFTNAGGTPAARVAKWDGNTWSTLGSGLGNTVYALASSGSNIYAGGFFTNAGGVDANYVAKWDGNQWSCLGSGMDYSVSHLAFWCGDLYAGGSFTSADGTLARGIARWNGTIWSGLGSGLNNQVQELAVFNNELFVCGTFTVADGKIPAYLAKLTTAPLANAQKVIAEENTPKIITLSAGNVQGDLSSFTILTAPTNATLTGDPPALTYTPNADFHGFDSFTFKVNEGGRESAAATVSITVLSRSCDTDGDGLSDAAEYALSSVGFNWQMRQVDFVNAFVTNATTAGLYTKAQLEAQHPGKPLLERDPVSGLFRVTVGVERSTDLLDFTSVPMTPSQTTTTADGTVEFNFQGTNTAEFFRLQAR